MGFYRRRGRFRGRGGRRRRPRRVSRTWAKSKKGAASQSQQIMTLQRQVNRLNLRTKDSLKYVQYHLDLTANVGALAQPLYQVWNLIQPDQWQPIFQTKTADYQTITPDKFRGRSIGIEIMAQINRLGEVPVVSQKPITATVFVCSLRKEVAKQFVHSTTNGTTMIEDVHFCKANMGTLQGSGMVMLNKGIFNIRYVKRFMLGGVTNFQEALTPTEDSVSTTNLKDNNRRIYIKLPYRNLLKDDGPDNRTATTGTGFKKLTINTVSPTDQLYVFMFANSYADQAVAFHANAVITGQVNNN